MRYVLRDDDVDPRRLLRPRSDPHVLADVAGAADGGAAAVLQAFVGVFRARDLEWLRDTTARGVGCGTEFGHSTFDDDLDPEEERFQGVRLRSSLLRDEIVMSKSAYGRLVEALLALPPPR